jgi:outer membrane receptor protein involved in Fe transport
MRLLSYALLSSASFAALALTAPAGAQTPQPVHPERDPCQAPADQRDPNVTCPPADTQAGKAVQAGKVESGNGEAIMVVGSRIRRNRFNTADPVTIISRDTAVDAGFNSTAEVLQSVGVTGGTAQITDQFGGLVVNGGPGVNTLSLRGLGATRTLVLLNGRRLAPAGTRGSVGSADLNVLPTAILDRIEVLNTGASSIYGSDAVAGVVNIVTRKKFDGLSLEATVDQPEIGAGTEKRFSVVAGTSGSRFSLVGSVEVYDRDRLTIGDQPWARCPTSRYLSGEGTEPGSGDYIDPKTGQPKCFNIDEGGVTVNTIGTRTIVGSASNITLAPNFWMARSPTTFEQPYPAGFTQIRCNRWRPNSTVTTGLMPGFECVGGSLRNPSTGQTIGASLNIRDTFAPSLLDQDIISPTRNYTGYVSGTYDTDFFGDGQLYGELLVTRRKSQQNGQRQFTIDYLPDSPLVPASINAAQGAGVFGGIRVFADYGIYDSHQTQDYIKASGGFRGNLPFQGWRYDLYGSKSWADGKYHFEQILTDRLYQSMDVVDNGNGTFSCANDFVGDCVAAPVLTPDIIAGRARQVAPAWFDYVTEDLVGTTKFRESMGNLTLDGPLFRLPGGDAQLAVGVEYRKSRIADIPDPEMQRGNNFGFSSAGKTIGSDSVWEAFGEVELPILRNVPFASAFTLNASGRYTHYKSYGGDKTYKVGGLYSPTRWLSFRGSYGTSFRAPALFEQFLSPTSGFQPSNFDPCDQLLSVTDAATRARCLAEGLPADFEQKNGVQVNQIGGAAAGLKAETSKNLTLGTVFQPTFGDTFGNLSLAVDYYRIEVDNGVGQLSESSLLQGCYTNAHPEYCRFITREPFTIPGTGALTVNTSFINIATDLVKGIDFVLTYDRRLGPGKFDLGAEAVRTLKRINKTDPDSPALDYVGTIGNPKWAGVGHAGYEIGPWYFRWGVEYLKGTNDQPFNEENVDPSLTTDRVNFSVPDYWLHTATIRWEKGRYSVTAGVRNVFDKDPPKITAGDPLVNTTSNVPLQSGWDFRGRTYFVNLRAKVF